MSEQFKDAYAKALADYLASTDESTLRVGYELGRTAIQTGLGVLDLAEAHHSAYVKAHQARRDDQDPEELAGAASTFFMEALSAFEMIQRGYREAQEMASLEKQHADQLRGLAGATMAIGASLSPGEIIRVMSEEARHLMEALCAFVILDAESMPASDLCVRCARYLEKADLPSLQQAVASHQPTPLRSEDLARYGPWDADEHDRGWISLAAPLMGAGERAPGSLHVVHREDGEFTERDWSMLVQIAQVGGTALENARRYEQERRTSVTLQRALLPGALPRLPGVELTARYEPGSTEVSVGGDWYDVVRLSETRLGVAIGDIAGHGLRAASSMGQARMAFRASVEAGLAPAAVVERVNRLLSGLESPHFSTMVYLALDSASGEGLMVRAGHPPPLIVGADGNTWYADVGHSMALGIDPEARFEQEAIALEPGSTLLLYTDGLLGRHLPDAATDLAKAAAGSVGSLEERCDRILEAMLPDELQDDVALLALRLV